MGWIVRYARVGNAEPVYTVTNSYGDQYGLFTSVKDVAAVTNRALKSVRIACRDAREYGVSHFLD